MRIRSFVSHGFSMYHHYQEKYQGIKIPSSNFLNGKTIVLMDFIKDKCENNVYDLSDGLKYISDFFMNFGVRFEDHPDHKGYISVFDI